MRDQKNLLHQIIDVRVRRAQPVKERSDERRVSAKQRRGVDPAIPGP
jgi:hypothetical protein